MRNAFAAAAGIDAAYTDGAGLYVLLGDQIIRYADCIENGGVRVDEGYPRRLEQHFTDLPAEFESGIEAAFAEPGSSRVHLFKDGRTVSPAPGDKIVRRVDKRWGQLGPVLPTGSVDAAFVGVDGRTYLFSGDRYLRYTGADYSRVDAGYPRRIAARLGRDRAAWTPRSCSTARPTCSARRASCSASRSRRSSSGPPTRACSTRATSRPSCGNGCSSTACASADAGWRAPAPSGRVPLDGGARVVVRREADAG